MMVDKRSPDDPWYVLVFFCVVALIVLIAIDVGRAFRWLWRVVAPRLRWLWLRFLPDLIFIVIAGTLIACAVVILGWGGWR